MWSNYLQQPSPPRNLRTSSVSPKVREAFVHTNSGSKGSFKEGEHIPSTSFLLPPATTWAKKRRPSIAPRVAARKQAQSNRVSLCTPRNNDVRRKWVEPRKQYASKINHLCERAAIALFEQSRRYFMVSCSICPQFSQIFHVSNPCFSAAKKGLEKTFEFLRDHVHLSSHDMNRCNSAHGTCTRMATADFNLALRGNRLHSRINDFREHAN